MRTILFYLLTIEITSNIDTIEKSNGLIIPGVSTTDTVLSNIKQLGLEETIKNFYNSGKPILCICVGMQILFETKKETDDTGSMLDENNIL